MKKVFRILGNLIAFIILLAGVFVMFTALWVRRTWPKLSASSIIFQLQNSLEGTGNGMIGTFVLTTIVPTVILTAAVVFLFFFFRKHRKLITLTSGLMGVALFVLAICLLWNRIGLGDYLKYRNKKSTFIEDNYVDPDKVDIRFPDKKRNIIYIYLESMELAYADTENGGNMDENLIQNLTKLEEVGEDALDTERHLRWFAQKSLLEFFQNHKAYVMFCLPNEKGVQNGGISQKIINAFMIIKRHTPFPFSYMIAVSAIPGAFIAEYMQYGMLKKSGLILWDIYSHLIEK